MNSKYFSYKIRYFIYKSIYNFCLYIDLLFNKRAYIKRMRDNGFITINEKTTLGELFSFFKKPPLSYYS